MLDDQQRGDRAIHAEPFHPIGERGLNVCECDTADERQKDFMQQPQQCGEHGDRHEPEGEMAAVHDGISPSAQPAEGQGLISAAFMWRTHSAT